MKSAKLFLFGLYAHLLFSVLIPIAILYFCSDGWDALGIGLIGFYFAEMFTVHVIGWICAAMSIAACHRSEEERLRSAWKLLKLRSIPFYILNFLYRFFVWFCLVGASRGLMIFFVPIPIIITCTMIFQSGCVGISYIKLLRQQSGNNKKPSKIHYFLQLLAVLDIVSTMILLKKYKEKICP